MNGYGVISKILSTTSCLEKNTLQSMFCVRKREHMHVTYTHRINLLTSVKRNTGRIPQKWNQLPSEDEWKQERKDREVDGTSEYTSIFLSFEPF